MCATGLWHDVGVAVPFLEGRDVFPACFKNAISDGIRIDAVFCNTVAMAGAKDFSVNDGVALPTHRVLQIEVAADMYGQMMLRPRLSKVFPMCSL